MKKIYAVLTMIFIISNYVLAQDNTELQQMADADQSSRFSNNIDC